MHPAPATLFERLASLIAWLVDHVVGPGVDSGADPSTPQSPGLAPPRRDSLIARLRGLAARLATIARTPIPPPRPPLPPLEHGFICASYLCFPTGNPPPPERPRLPAAWCWLVRLLPPTLTGRAQLEDLLRAPEMQDTLNADRRVGPLLRPLAWMLGVERALLPATRRRRRPLIVVPGGSTEAEEAAAKYGAERGSGATAAAFIARHCTPSSNRRDRRPVWRGHYPVSLDGPDYKSWGTPA